MHGGDAEGLGPMDSEGRTGGGTEGAGAAGAGARTGIVFRNVGELLEHYGYDPNGRPRLLETLIYNLTAYGAHVQEEDGGLDIWADVEGRTTAHWHPTFPMTQEHLLDVMKGVDAGAAEIQHRLSCHGPDCPGEGCPGCMTYCIHNPMPYVPGQGELDGSVTMGVDPGGVIRTRIGIIRSERRVAVQLEQEDWDDVNGDVSALSFHIPSVGSFELLGTLEELDALMEDARHLIRDAMVQRHL